MSESNKKQETLLIKFLRIVSLVILGYLEYIFVRDTVIFGTIGAVIQTTLFIFLSILFCWALYQQINALFRSVKD